MAAGLGFKTFNTGDVLSAADVNGYLMQGILVFASATARDAAITSPEEGQFAFLKDTNVTTYYTGSAWANVDTTGMTNPMTTTGDVIYSSSGSTPARLGIGTAGQVLQVNSGATAPEWATPASGGMTVIASGSMSSTSLLISSIPSTYVDLVLEIDSFFHNVANWGWSLRLNDDNTASRYFNSTAFATVGSGTAFNASQIQMTFDNGGVQSSSTGKIRVLIPSYAISTSWKMVQAYGLIQQSAAVPGNFYFQANAGLYNQTTAISSMRIVPNTGATIAGDYTLYGVK
jgi:hypothetical protein